MWHEHLRHELIDFFHLQHHIVWNASFSQQHIQLARHSPRDWMNTEDDFHTCRAREDITGRRQRSLNQSRSAVKATLE